MQLLLPEESSWMKSDGCYVIDLEVLEVKDKNCKSINFLIKDVATRKDVELLIVVAGKRQGTMGQHVCV